MKYTLDTMPRKMRFIAAFWVGRPDEETHKHVIERTDRGDYLVDNGASYRRDQVLGNLNAGDWIILEELLVIEPFMRVIYAEDVYIVVKIEGEIFYGVGEDGNSWPMKLESIVAAYNPPDDARDYLNTEVVGELIYVTEELITQSKEELQAYTDVAIQLEHEFEIARKNLDNAKNRHNEIMEATEGMVR